MSLAANSEDGSGTAPQKIRPAVGGHPDHPPRIIYLTSGAAGMFCGSCLHDNTLARGLSKAGVDIQLLPTYTPIRTDEPDASQAQVFFGGLNVYLAQKIPGYAWLPNWLTGWLDHPALLRWATSFGIQTDARDLGALAVSMLRGEQGRQRREVAKLVNWLTSHGPFDLLHFTNLLIGGCIPAIKARLRCPVVVTLQGDDIFLDYLPEPYRAQALTELRRLVPHVDRFVVNSRYYGEYMGELLGIAPSRWTIVPLTIDTRDFLAEERLPQTSESVALSAADGAAERSAERSAERQRNGPVEGFNIGYLARLAPEKGLHVLVDAFIELKRRPGMEHARLRIAGWLGEHRREYAEEQFRKLRSEGLTGEFEYVGEVDRRMKVEFLRGLDLFSVPTTYREPKGLFVLEALASGVPVVLPSHGAFPELLERLGGGRLVPPENPKLLADALESLLHDALLRRELGATGRDAVMRQANLDVLTDTTLTLYGELLGRPIPRATPRDAAELATDHEGRHPA